MQSFFEKISGFRMKSYYYSTMVAVMLVFTASCANTQVSFPTAKLQTGSVLLEEDLSDFISTAQEGASRHFVTQQWAQGITVDVHTDYHAASGKRCRTISLTDATYQKNYWSACQEAMNQWSLSRDVTRLSRKIQ